MIIGVLADLGGERLLGRAREIADSQGYRVIALCSDSKKSNSDRLIALGADGVELFAVKSAGDWINAISELVRKNFDLRIVLLTSNILGDYILGGVSAAVSERVGSVLDCADSVSEIGATKSLPGASISLSASIAENSVSIFSVKLSSVPEPFEDASRYGKVAQASVNFAPNSYSTPSLSEFGIEYTDPSSRLAIIKGSRNSESFRGLIEKLASKYGALLLNEENMKGRKIYGPCLAIEVSSSLRELPEIQGELISLNSEKNDPISKVADVAIINQDIGKILEGLLVAH